jgi:hypothetical protein
MTEETFNGPENLSSSNQKLFTSLWDQIRRLFFCAEEGRLPCLRLIGRIVYDMDKGKMLTKTIVIIKQRTRRTQNEWRKKKRRTECEDQ